MWLHHGMNHGSRMGRGFKGSFSLERESLKGNVLFRLFHTVFGTSSLSTHHSLEIELTSNNPVLNTRKVLDTSSTDEHHRVLLKFVLLSWNVGNHHLLVGKSDAGYLTQGRVGLLGCSGIDFDADSFLERVSFQGTSTRLLYLFAPRISKQLIDCRHSMVYPSRNVTGFLHSMDSMSPGGSNASLEYRLQVVVAYANH